jgi:hypothetical protein
MLTIKPLPQFTSWLDDPTVRGIIVARLKRLEHG